MDLVSLKDRLKGEVEARAKDLIEASHQIHEHPETNYEEHFAHDLLSRPPRGGGAAPSSGARTASTRPSSPGPERPARRSRCSASTTPCPASATRAATTSSPRAGLGAGLAAAALADEAGGRVVLLGTPAEEGGGGKVLMARQGAFDGVDAAMMVHPAGDDLARMDVIAVQELTATYTGIAAHAAAFPHRAATPSTPPCSAT